MAAIWSLPTTVTVSGEERGICTDFRDILEIIGILQDQSREEASRVYVALSLFYDHLEEIPPGAMQEAAEAMTTFLNCGEADTGTPAPKTIDWEQDAGIIVSEVNKVAGTEIRNLEYLHWWTFISYFNGIGEGQLSFVVGIREKRRRGKKLEPYEQEFFNRNRSVVELKQTLTTEEEDELSKWLGK